MEHSPGGNHGIGESIHTEALQTLCAELRRETHFGGIGGEDPIIEVESSAAVVDIIVTPLAQAIDAEQLLGLDVAEEFVDILYRALRAEELTGGDIEESDTDRLMIDMDGGEEIIFFRREGIIVEVDTGSDKFGDATLH